MFDAGTTIIQQTAIFIAGCEGCSGFDHHKQFASGGSEIHVVLGQGQVHFFFVRAADLYWFGTAPGMARAGLAQLLDMALEELPTLDSLLSVP